MCSYSDDALGQVMAKLKALDLERSTAIVLVSDHGDTLGRHRMMSKDFAFSEHAMRTPMIFAAPGESSAGLPRGVVQKDPVSGVDVYPTLCEFMGLPAPGPIDGESLVSRWRGDVVRPNREILSGQGVPGKNRARMLRTPKFKSTRYDDGGEELYDLERDSDELENLVVEPKYAKMVAEFRNRTASL
jgi:choline-sulfatase